ncbi:MAG: STAS domain-containing protein [Planctomycetaceae bacterium]|nr:STAS domain-containing protein [Planctomycetaceae bacterium]
MWEQTRHGVVDIISGTGPLNMETAEPLRKLLENRTAGGQPRLVLDCRNIALIDSAGLELLLDTRDACILRGGQFHLSSLNALCRDILHITGVLEHFEVYNDSVAASGSFSQ